MLQDSFPCQGENKNCDIRVSCVRDWLTGSFYSSAYVTYKSKSHTIYAL